FVSTCAFRLTSCRFLLCAPSSAALLSLFFFNAPAPTEIYTLSLHDALPISAGDDRERRRPHRRPTPVRHRRRMGRQAPSRREGRSEEHTSELQSRENLVCRLLLEKKKTINQTPCDDGRARRESKDAIQLSR